MYEWVGQRKDLRTRRLAAIALTIYAPFLLASSTVAIAQDVVPDNTLPNRSVVTSTADGALQSITGGTQSGDSVFHSFQTFSILDGQTVEFLNDTTLSHIFTRVTGDALSSIDGRLTTQGTTDFFLLNPNGIVFGAGAELNVGGAFIGSTGDRLLFDGGAEFSAVAPQAPPLLTISTPVGVQYGSNPGPIQVEGNGHQLFLDPDTLAVNATNRPVGVQVNAGNTLALIGGAVQFTGGNVTAEDGRVAIGAVGPEQTVTLIGDELGWALAYDEVNSAQFQDIQFTQAASASTSGAQGGSIQVQGNGIRLTQGSTLLSNTLDRGSGRGIIVDAGDRIIIRGDAADTGAAPSFPSSVLAEVGQAASGTGGDIILRGDRLRVVDAGQISTTTFGRGEGGTLTVAANRVVLSGSTADRSSGLFVNAELDATGQGGQLFLDAEQLIIRDGGQIQSSTFGAGDGGRITLSAERTRVIGVDEFGDPSGIFAETDGPGNGGAIALQGDRLDVLDGGQISSSSFSAGNGGSIQLNVGTIQLDRSDAAASFGDRSAIVSSTVGRGQGGPLEIVGDRLWVNNGSQLTTSTFAAGDAGDLTIVVDDIQLTGVASDPTGFFALAEPGSTGAGGTLRVEAERLWIDNGAQMGTATFGDGDAGALQVDADDVRLTGGTARGASGLFASAIFGNGDGNDLIVTADTITISDGATLNASNFASNAEVPAGRGAAGTIRVRANAVQLSRGGEITTSTNAGDQGNIQVESDRIFLTDESRIITNADSSDGGNIDLSAELILALRDSDITANANAGNGGRVVITAQTLFGAAERDRLTRFSDITATSNRGAEFNGIVQINAPDSDIQPDEGNLPSATVDIDQLIAESCIRPRDRGQFWIGGQDVPPNPPLAPSTFGFETYTLPQVSTDDRLSPNARIDWTLREDSIGGATLFLRGNITEISTGQSYTSYLDTTEPLTSRCTQ